jgi:YD repeat-containing protein
MKNIIMALVVFVGAHSAFPVPLNAQASNCLTQVGNGPWFGGAIPLPGIFDCTFPGPWLVNCAIWTSNCAPPAASSETCPTCQAATASNPVSLATGNTFIKETDVRIPGLSGGLTLVRTWNSLWPASQRAVQIGLFGPNWRSNFEERVFVGTDNYIKYARGDGSFWSFGYSGAGFLAVAAPANTNASLVTGTSFWTLTFQNGEKRLFDNTSGNLISIIDRNGNTTQLTYDGVGRLSAVTDPVSRHLYFSYGSGSSYLIVGVTSDFGMALTYAYDAQNRLSVITNPDNSTLTFQYNSQSLITSVTDSQGKVLEQHTYDGLGRGLTSAKANGVEAVSFSYAN